MSQRCLLAVHAHPDDETVSTGGTLAYYASLGFKVILVTCTRGEEGEIVDAELKTAIADSAPTREDAQEGLALQREKELAAAIQSLHITTAYQLGYRDSGMDGTSANQHPRAFCNAAISAAVAKVVEIVRREKPQVIVTYNEVGGYGHPDHIMAHRIATLAFEAVANTTVYPQLSDETPAWQPTKLYYAQNSRDHMRAMLAMAEQQGIELPFRSWIASQDQKVLLGEPVDPNNPHRPPFGVTQDAITTTIDIRAQLAQKRAALHDHRTQIRTDQFLLGMSDEVASQVYGTEFYTLVRSRIPAVRPETDLFAGIE